MLESKRKTRAVRGRRHSRPVAARKGALTPGGALADAVAAIFKKHVEEGCERALSDLSRALGVAVLLPKADPSTVSARRGIRAMMEQFTRSLARVAVAALLLPSSREWPPRGFPRRRAKLTVVGNGRVANWTSPGRSLGS